MTSDQPGVDMSGVDLVRLTTTSGRIEVTAEDRPDLSFSTGTAERRGSTITITAGSGRLDVRVPEGISVVVGSESGRVTLAGTYGGISVSNGSGRISIDRARSVDVRSQSGRVEVKRCEHRCRIVNASGAVRVGRAGELDAHTETGRIDAEAVDGQVRARTTNGRIDIGILGPGDIAAETISGRIQLTLAQGLGAQVAASSGTNRVENSAPRGDDCRVEARTVSGRVQVRSA
jgi:DUF4097 and DUF4098 domain-containing protein YvlB